ncbi:NACHT domain-containing protein [Saccharopolyspora sp. NPDC002376]
MILGRAGAGKTVLAHRLILDLLNNTATGPVPVLFSISDWNPATELRSWLAEYLVRDFPFLDAPDAVGKKLAEVFVFRGLILPVLDGFDEIPERHRPAAVRQISTLDLPLILTSRPGEYARAAYEIKAVGGAAAIMLEDLTLEETHEYLRQSTGKPRGPVWDGVFEQLRTAPEARASRNLTTVLTSPLMVMLARTVYNDNPGRHPGELLDTGRFSEAEDLEDHLLDVYVDTVYTLSNGPQISRRPNWNPEQAHRWLGYLANHLVTLKTHDLTWWQLPATLHHHTRILTTAATGGLLGWLALALTSVPGLWLREGIAEWLAYVLWNGFRLGLVVGLGLGLTAGIIKEVGFSRWRTGREPERLRLSLRKRGRDKSSLWTYIKKSLPELISGVTIGVAFGLAYGLAMWLSTAPQEGAAIGFIDHVLGLVLQLVSFSVLGLLGGLLYGLVSVGVSALGDDHDPHATDPWTLLTRDRTVTLVRTTASVLTFGMVIWFAVGLLADWDEGVFGLGLGLGLFAGVVHLVLSVWGSWLLFVRLWLPLTGRLPWRPKRFLEDAHDRGVLRRTGAVYQFRHARLRDHLATQDRS